MSLLLHALWFYEKKKKKKKHAIKVSLRNSAPIPLFEKKRLFFFLSHEDLGVADRHSVKLSLAKLSDARLIDSQYRGGGGTSL